MSKARSALVLLLALALLAQCSTIAVADENGEFEESEADDMNVCLSAVFLLLVLLVAISLVVLTFSRRHRKS